MHQRLAYGSAPRFGVDDPPSTGATSALTSTAPPRDAGPTAPLDILVVDDNPNNLLAMEVALGELAPRMVRAASGEHALKRLLETDFAVILLDVQMPNMDGFETARLIRCRERTRHVPIIFVTAYNQVDADIRKGYQLGAVDFLFKPVVPEVLKAKVQVFVELCERTQQVARQEQQLRELERLEAERRLQDERSKWEAELLRRQNQQLELADQRKDEFIAMLGHELRNPLSPLVAGVQMLQELHGSEQESATLQQVQQVMERQVHHLTRLVDDLLDVSRISRGKVELQPERLDLTPIVERAVENCRHGIEEKLQKLQVTAPAGEVLLQADPVRLTQVVTNLLSNASRYTPTHGSIEVVWERTESQAILRVADNGRGIRPELRERIFDMFVQERDGGRGLGLGLTLVKQVVELHGGRVEARSAGLEQGSEFVVYLPLLTQEPAVLTATAESPVQPHTEEALAIALVDDDDDVRHMMQILLTRWGHHVLPADSGGRGVELVLQAQPDVALLDIGLPDLDGYKVAQRIRDIMGKRCPRLVAMTGFGQTQDRERAFAAGFDAHLVKPAKADELRRALRPTETE